MGKKKEGAPRVEERVQRKRGRDDHSVVEGAMPVSSSVSRRGVTLAIVASASMAKKRIKTTAESKTTIGKGSQRDGGGASSSTSGPLPYVVGKDPAKGRVLVASRAIAVGEVVLEDEPLVCASSFDHRCIQCNSAHPSASCAKARAALPNKLVQNLGEIEEEMEELEAIELEVDRIRCFIKLLHMVAARPQIMDDLRQCTAANIAECADAVSDIRDSKLMRQILPGKVSDQDAATILGVLNTNSHELGEWGGSGLYMKALLMEHDCRPNCSFTTHGTRLWVTAIEDIAEGEHLSIDYGEAVFVPTADRMAHHKDNYGFECTCKSCTLLPDRCRAFTCPKKGCPGPVCPTGDGKALEGWKCLVCGKGLTASEKKAREKAEEDTVVSSEHLLKKAADPGHQRSKSDADDSEAIADLDNLLKGGMLHETHHEAFHLLVEMGEEMAGNPLDVMSGRAQRVWRRVVELSEQVLQKWHSKKAIFHDNLAQVLVAQGDIAGGKKAFKTAWEIMRRCSGETTAPTLAAKALADKTPKTSAELAKTYANVREQEMAGKAR